MLLWQHKKQDFSGFTMFHQLRYGGGMIFIWQSHRQLWRRPLQRLSRQRKPLALTSSGRSHVGCWKHVIPENAWFKPFQYGHFFFPRQIYSFHILCLYICSLIQDTRSCIYGQEGRKEVRSSSRTWDTGVLQWFPFLNHHIRMIPPSDS